VGNQEQAVKKKLPNGHAYIRIRNAGFSVHIDFRDKDVPFVEQMMKLVMDKHAEWLKEQKL
jgi:hypothetical protein